MFVVVSFLLLFFFFFFFFFGRCNERLHCKGSSQLFFDKNGSVSYAQYNFNGSNTFGTMKICSRQG